ncbi:MAG: IS3 family transposase [Candidatus Cybelea sp.]
MVPTPYGMVRLTITIFSRAFNIPRSAFYRPAQPPLRKGDLRVVAAIKDILIKHPRYGYRQVTNRLRRKRIVINIKRTLRLMRSHDLQHKPLRRPKWRGGHAAGELANLSRFNPTAPDQLWVTDITFVRLRSYWIYLAVMVDAFSRRCVGWALGTRISTELTLEALQMSIVSRRPKATLVHHSDRGSQYGSSGYQDALLERELKQSWSRPGTPTDNPVCERFIGTLKREEIWVRAYVDFEDARKSIGAFIHDYNENRSHSSLGKRSPAEFERMYRQAAKSQPVQAELSVP